MIAVQRWISASGSKSRLIMQVHDELVLEVPESEIDGVRKQLPELMNSVAKLDVPLAVDLGVGPNWEQAH
jgi:DNA polymerase-1